jgi:hypothetical protein
MIERHTATSFFLLDHPALAAFTACVRRGMEEDPLFPFAIVCERKEDVISLRAQLFAALHPRGQRQSALGGGSVYTLDSLGQALTQWAQIALRVCGQVERLGSLSSTDLRRRYLDIVTQEKLTEQVLYQIGYSGTDALPLAKQILTLLDTPLPPEASLYDVLIGSVADTGLGPVSLESGAAGRGRGLRERNADQTGHQALTFILARLQATRAVMGRFSRLQSLVTEGLAVASSEDWAALLGALPFAPALERGAVLWLAAPSYGHSHSENRPVQSATLYRPGNFPSAITQGLLDACLLLRRTSAEKQELKPQPFIMAETMISAPADPLDPVAHRLASVTVHPAPESFFSSEPAARMATLARHSPIGLLGDVDMAASNAVQSYGQGTHAASLHDKTAWLLATSAGKAPPLPQVVTDAIETWAADHHALANLLDPSASDIAAVADAYGITSHTKSPEQRFLLSSRSLRYRVGAPHPLAELTQALAFCATTKRPEAIVVFGRPHAARSASLNVRFLNAVFYRLMCAGVDVELPASDLMYRSFWKNLMMQGLPVHFVLPDPAEQKELEGYFRQPDCNRAGAQAGRLPTELLPPRPISKLWESHPWAWAFLTDGIYPALDPNWQRNRQQVRNGKSHVSNANAGELSVTAFEDYVLCPFKFYLQHVLLLFDRSTDAFAPDARAAGTQIHDALERLTSLLNLWLSTFQDQTGDIRMEAQHMICALLAAWRDALFEPNCFAAQTPEAWKQAFVEALQATAQPTPKPTPVSSLGSDLLAAQDLLMSGAGAALEPVFASPIDQAPNPHGHPSMSQQGRSSSQKAQQPISSALTVEAKKRYFVRYLHAEVGRLQTDVERNSIRQIAFSEEPVRLTLGPLSLRGRIDRVDVVRSANVQLPTDDEPPAIEHELIDYKTSRPPREEAELALFPDSLLSPAKQKLSIQGGLYVLAWAERLAEHASTCNLLSFSLYRLGSLDWHRDMILKAALPLASEVERERDLAALRQKYEAYASRLHEGHFPAQPLDGSQCAYCSFRSLCPTGRGQTTASFNAAGPDHHAEEEP